MGDQGAAEFEGGGEFLGGGGKFGEAGERFEVSLDFEVGNANGQGTGLLAVETSGCGEQCRIEHGEDRLSLPSCRGLAAAGKQIEREIRRQITAIPSSASKRPVEGSDFSKPVITLVFAAAEDGHGSSLAINVTNRGASDKPGMRRAESIQPSSSGSCHSGSRWIEKSSVSSIPRISGQAESGTKEIICRSHHDFSPVPCGGFSLMPSASQVGSKASGGITVRTRLSRRRSIFTLSRTRATARRRKPEFAKLDRAAAASSPVSWRRSLRPGFPATLHRTAVGFPPRRGGWTRAWTRLRRTIGR